MSYPNCKPPPLDHLAEIQVDPSQQLLPALSQIRPLLPEETKVVTLFDVKPKMPSTQFCLPRNGLKTIRYGGSWYWKIKNLISYSFPIPKKSQGKDSHCFICFLNLFDKVSSTPATRLDVLALQEQLDSRLKQRQAREIGICPIRRELYSQCFGILYSISTDFSRIDKIKIYCNKLYVLKKNYWFRWADPTSDRQLFRERIPFSSSTRRTQFDTAFISNPVREQLGFRCT